MKSVILSIFTFSFFAIQTTPTSRTEVEAKKIIDSLYFKVKNGADFGKLAILYSEDPATAQHGGKYEKMKKSDFVDEFAKNISVLKLNEVSKPFKTEYGFHIVQLLNKQGDLYTVRHILITYKQ